jgi:type 1 fimbriae regulatory protein FimB/type 1 fimbriae regulatory protein FimE
VRVSYTEGSRAADGAWTQARELCALRWDQIDFAHGLLDVRRLKNGIDSVHPLGGTQLRALRALKRDDGSGRYVFTTEREAPMTTAGFRKLVARIGARGHFWCTRTCCGMLADMIPSTLT